ncbi:hypothetical protein J2847_002662 [Azospirillum agricola]|uniref:hypothetical protein n=1 Tax=Azospirillum agricola TaxID=1720247 RepID=UPI001AE710C3|nr:hypothetical protein [Azospirillum agricola]MBP2229368.1 hypothetical protein [Azospirillum agricola]
MKKPTVTLTLADFLAGPGGDLLHRLGLPSDRLANCTGWAALRSLAVAHNDKMDGELWDVAEQLNVVLSTGERVVLHALLAALDFSNLADKLTGDEGAWRLLDFAHGAHRDAVAAAILRQD